MCYVSSDVGQAVVTGALEHAGVTGAGPGQVPPHRWAPLVCGGALRCRCTRPPASVHAHTLGSAAAAPSRRRHGQACRCSPPPPPFGRGRRALFCGTLAGKVSLVRQLEPELHIDGHPQTVGRAGPPVPACCGTATLAPSPGGAGAAF